MRPLILSILFALFANVALAQEFVEPDPPIYIQGKKVEWTSGGHPIYPPNIGVITLNVHLNTLERAADNNAQQMYEDGGEPSTSWSLGNWLWDWIFG